MAYSKPDTFDYLSDEEARTFIRTTTKALALIAIRRRFLSLVPYLKTSGTGVAQT